MWRCYFRKPSLAIATTAWVSICFGDQWFFSVKTETQFSVPLALGTGTTIHVKMSTSPALDCVRKEAAGSSSRGLGSLGIAYPSCQKL
jgi:hypothetical protein